MCEPRGGLLGTFFVLPQDSPLNADLVANEANYNVRVMDKFHYNTIGYRPYSV
jgi:hypothetical protein